MNWVKGWIIIYSAIYSILSPAHTILILDYSHSHLVFVLQYQHSILENVCRPIHALQSCLYSQQLWPARESQYKLTEINIKDTVLIEFLVIVLLLNHT